MDFIGYLIGLAIAFVIGVFITRWIFGIEKIIHQLGMQTDSLKEINKIAFEQRAFLNLMAIEKLGFYKHIVVNAKKDGKIIYPTLDEWIEKYSGVGYTTDIIDK